MAFPFRRISPSVIRSLRVDRAEECAAVHAAAFAHPWPANEIAALLTSGSTIGSGRAGSATTACAASRFPGWRRRGGSPDDRRSIRGWRRRASVAILMREHLQTATLAGARALFLEVDAENAAAIAL